MSTQSTQLQSILPPNSTKVEKAFDLAVAKVLAKILAPLTTTQPSTNNL